MVDPLLAKDLIAVCVSSSNKFRTFQQEVQRYNMCSTKSTINLDICANDFRNIKFFYILLKDLIKQLHLIINHHFAIFEGFSYLVSIALFAWFFKYSYLYFVISF